MDNDKDKDKVEVEVEDQSIAKDVDPVPTLELSLSAALNTALEDANPSEINIDQFFSFLKLSEHSMPYQDLNIDMETAVRMKNHLISMKHGTYAAVPLICSGPEKCPILSHCYFAKRSKITGEIDMEMSQFPMLRPCPVEASIMQLKIKQYLSQFLGQDVQVTPTTMGLITKLAEIDIYEIRCDMILSTGDKTGQGQDLLIQTVEAIKESTGEVIYGVKEHPILPIKERLTKQRDKILNQLLATPEAKLKAKSVKEGEKADLASQLTALNKRLTQVQEASGIIDMSDTHKYGNFHKE